MPTNQNTYNSRVTDEALEKRFRDTFKSQGGAELVDDLYASGVIIPVVDFTQAAEGSQLPTNLQTAWDFSTGNNVLSNTAGTTIISNPGFWQVDVQLVTADFQLAAGGVLASLYIDSGITTKVIWSVPASPTTGAATQGGISEEKMTVFLRSGDSLVATARTTNEGLSVWYRQIATVTGDLVNPFGFTSS